MSVRPPLPFCPLPLLEADEDTTSGGPPPPLLCCRPASSRRVSRSRSALLRERDVLEAQAVPMAAEVTRSRAARGRCRDSTRETRRLADTRLRHRPPGRPALALLLRLLLCRWRENASSLVRPITGCSLEAPDADADVDEETHANADEDCEELVMALALEAFGGCVHVGFVRGKRRGRCFSVGVWRPRG